MGKRKVNIVEEVELRRRKTVVSNELSDSESKESDGQELSDDNESFSNSTPSPPVKRKVHIERPSVQQKTSRDQKRQKFKILSDDEIHESIKKRRSSSGHSRGDERHRCLSDRLGDVAKHEVAQPKKIEPFPAAVPRVKRREVDTRSEIINQFGERILIKQDPSPPLEGAALCSTDDDRRESHRRRRHSPPAAYRERQDERYRSRTADHKQLDNESYYSRDDRRTERQQDERYRDDRFARDDRRDYHDSRRGGYDERGGGRALSHHHHHSRHRGGQMGMTRDDERARERNDDMRRATRDQREHDFGAHIGRTERNGGRHEARQTAPFVRETSPSMPAAGAGSTAPPPEKKKANMGLSGKLMEDSNVFKGVVINYNEPPEARKPKTRWRLYPFKGDESLEVLYLHRQSAYLIGRQRGICDFPIDHPSCSKQHAVLQYRLVPYDKPDGRRGQRIRPYIIDLGSTNGTFVNNKKIDSKRYYELFEKDVLKFGFSSREYVLLHEKSEDDDEIEEGAGGDGGTDEPAAAAEEPAT